MRDIAWIVWKVAGGLFFIVTMPIWGAALLFIGLPIYCVCEALEDAKRAEAMRSRHGGDT